MASAAEWHDHFGYVTCPRNDKVPAGPLGGRVPTGHRDKHREFHLHDSQNGVAICIVREALAAANGHG